jgi:uncharacterized metal-binding protein YceD (DUF177 family)
MSKQTEHLPFSRPLKIDEIREGANGSIEATEPEMAAIAKLLDLRGLEGLTMSYRLYRAGAGRIGLNGELKAVVTQTCVVSLEPVQSEISVPVEAEYWPSDMIAAHVESEEGEGGTEWPEPISDGKIDLGPIIYETLATSLDPYPKKEGVSFEWSQAAEEPKRETGTSPFAALGALKRR